MIIKKTVAITDENGSTVTLPAELAAQVEEGKTYTYTPATLEEVTDPNADTSGH